MNASLYYEPEISLQDRIRSFAAAATISWMSWLDYLAKFDTLDELRWGIEGILHELFSIWHSDTPDSFQMVLNGEMYLEHTSDWEKSRFVDFDNTVWRCWRCETEICAWQADEGRCPCCDEGGLYFTGETLDDEESEPTSPRPSWTFSPLLLTERRAA